MPAKQAKATMEIISSTPEAATKESSEDMPSIIELIGPSFNVLSQAAVLIRKGFSFSSEQPPVIYSTGLAMVVLTPGNPESAAIEAATEAFDHALSRETLARMDAQQRAEAAEKERAEEIAKAAARALLAAQITAAESELKALQAAQAAA